MMAKIIAGTANKIGTHIANKKHRHASTNHTTFKIFFTMDFFLGTITNFSCM